MKILIIPARGGSKGIKRKNLQYVNGLPLIERSIRTALRSTADLIIVSTDDLDIMILAEKYKGIIIHRRSKKSSQDDSSTESVLLEVIRDLGQDWDKESSIGFIQVTSPFLSYEIIDKGFELSKRNLSVFSASSFHGLVWQNKESWHPVNHPFERRPRRQEMNNFVMETGGFYCFPLKEFVKSEYRFCSPPLPIMVESIHSIEIDEIDELLKANLIATQFEISDFQKFTHIKLPKIIFTDFDGCLTDDKVRLNIFGHESVNVNRKDGLGVKRLAKMGIKVVIVSMEKNKIVIKRANKLSIEAITGVNDKFRTITEYLNTRNLNWGECWFLGNEVNDLEALEAAEMSFCPRDAAPEVFRKVQVVLSRRGGEGLLAEIASRLESANK